jgi:hypothetical protein
MSRATDRLSPAGTGARAEPELPRYSDRRRPDHGIAAVYHETVTVASTFSRSRPSAPVPTA